MKKCCLLIYLLLVLVLYGEPPHKILVGSPVRQKPNILKEFLASLGRLEQTSCQLDYYFVDDNDLPESREMLEAFRRETPSHCRIERGSPSESPYYCTEETHYWEDQQIWKVASYKNRMIELARIEGYDYLFLIDSDIVLHPKTIEQLISSQKEIVSNIFWTSWAPNSPPLPQVWLSDVYTLFEYRPKEQITQKEAAQRTEIFLQKLKKPGVYEVGGLGACTLISKTAMQKPISFDQIKNVSFWGEDRHFCIRAASLGIPLFVDTHYPALHLYRESDLSRVSQYIKKCENEEKRNYRLTLAMIMRNESGRYLREMLESAKEYITEAVIIDDASTDRSVEIVEEILKDIPHSIIKNQESKFANEVVLRKQLWEETVKTNPDWILCLDADEIFENRFRESIGELLAAKEVDVYYFRLYDFWDPTHYRSDIYWSAHENYYPFLVRYKPDRRYLWKETPQHCGRFPLTILNFPMKRSELRIKHFGWATEMARREKYERYMRLDPGARYGWKQQYDSILDPYPNLLMWIE